ncbi:hypothetical protein NQ318_006092 [Aromia moschata]|uniref:Uncharacterized protein n=1 Tax=Aromia moschata TaxID=1265417 RepID=A0AAV8Z280_9CUCU|nr:hypothetical protein NQ318_006092 [Aromia moschata]
MFVSKITAALLVITIHTISCSVQPHALAPAVVAPAIRYGLVVPQNVRPFAAQVSTFTKGLSVFAAPYAAGVLNAPAIVSRAVLPAPLAAGPLAPGVWPGAPAFPAPAAVPVAAAAPAVPVGPSHLLPHPFARW